MTGGLLSMGARLGAVFSSQAHSSRSVFPWGAHVDEARTEKTESAEDGVSVEGRVVEVRAVEGRVLRKETAKMTYAEDRVVDIVRELQEGQYMYNGRKVDGRDIPKTWSRNRYTHFCVAWSEHQTRTAILFDLEDGNRIQLYFCIPAHHHPSLRLCPIGDLQHGDGARKWSVARVDATLGVHIFFVPSLLSFSLQLKTGTSTKERFQSKKGT